MYPNSENEEQKIQDYKNNVNNNPLLKKYGLKMVNIKTQRFYKILAFLFILTLICLVGVIAYLGYNGHLASTIENVINPLLNASVEVQNNYDFKPQTSNNYDFKPNYTIYVNNIIDEVCA